MDFVEYLEKSQECGTEAVYNTGVEYMSLLDSRHFLYRWLLFHKPVLADRIQFLTDCFDWISCKEKKKKLLCLVGEPNAGKTVIVIGNSCCLFYN